MFKVGDRVKYVKSGGFDNLTLNNIYVVDESYIDDDGDKMLNIIDDSGHKMKTMFAWRFELCLRYQRKKKLEKICSNQGKK